VNVIRQCSVIRFPLAEGGVWRFMERPSDTGSLMDLTLVPGFKPVVKILERELKRYAEAWALRLDTSISLHQWSVPAEATRCGVGERQSPVVLWANACSTLTGHLHGVLFLDLSTLGIVLSKH
jgi:hypothetical protein